MSPSLKQPVALIGFSGVGKSHWSRQLTAAGWRHLDCDARIAERLGSVVPVATGQQPVHALAHWMGMPWTPGFAEREAKYLELEEAVTAEALDEATTLRRSGQPAVLDTTGSVIYLSESLRARLVAACQVVFLELPQGGRALLLDRFKAAPKPLVWGDRFRPLSGETRDQSLSRCFGELLEWREKRYRAMAHKCLEASGLKGCAALLSALRLD